jgi:hypothetical protein
MTPDQLRELYLTTPASFETRAIAVLLSLGLVVLVLWLVKRRSLREEYTPIWLGVAVAIALVSTVGPLLHWLARAVGAWTPSSALFFFGQVFLVAICLNYAVRLSKLTLQVKNLAQELALLRSAVDGDDSSLEAGHARR